MVERTFEEWLVLGATVANAAAMVLAAVNGRFTPLPIVGGIPGRRVSVTPGPLQ